MKLQTVKDSKDGRWFTYPCNFNCGSRCLCKVFVKDGEIIRCKTDDTHEDSWEWPQARACPMGWTQWQKVIGPERLKYPMKRKSWSPGDPHGELRGVDEWERISWDEALDYIAAELKSAKKKYGNSSIMYQDIFCIEGYLAPILAGFGGYTSVTSIDSNGTYQHNPAMYGVENYSGNDRMDLVNADYIVLYGHNPAWNNFSSMYYLKPAHEKGVKFAFVGPEYNVSAAAMDAEWFPVRQGTDTAFLLGVAYSMIALDQDGDILDYDFLNRCTVGFDAEHMPQDATDNENFRSYVLGEYDGVAKTPAWASEICGCPVEKIERFAQIVSRRNNVMMLSNSAPARNTGAENLPQLFMTVGAMGGHFGKSGNACALDYLFSTFDRGMPLVANGSAMFPFVFNPMAVSNPVDNTVTSTEIYDAILNGKYHDCGSIAAPQPAVEREVDIHVLISEQNNRLQTLEGTIRGIEALRSLDFVCSQGYYLKADAMYADIVLPIATRWERQTWNAYDMIGFNRDMALAHEQVCEALYESKSDFEVAFMLADRLGVDGMERLGHDEKQGWFNQIATTQVIDTAQTASSGAPTYKPLVTITQDDIDRYGVAGMPQDGEIGLEEFLEKGIYRFKRESGDLGHHIAFKQFRDDPEGNPLGTVSGKLEIYCQAKSDWFDMIHENWPNYTPVSPLPKLLPTIRGYVQSFEDWEKKVPGKYPYQVSNSHYLRGAHSDNNNLEWGRKILAQPLFISKEDAETKGIATGDIVKVSSPAGTVIRRASVNRCIMPGTLELPHGSRPVIDPETGIDCGGCDNTLTSGGATTSVANNAWNSTLVDFEKYEGPLTVADTPDAAIVPLSE